MNTEFTIIYKYGNTIDTKGFKAYTAESALAEFDSWKDENTKLLGIIPTEVFALLPDASVFFGIFPY